MYTHIRIIQRLTFFKGFEDYNTDWESNDLDSDIVWFFG